MHHEAMGFGDVTLLAMIGAFLGWQAAVIVFFLAPLAAVVVALGRLLLRGEKEIFWPLSLPGCRRHGAGLAGHLGLYG